MISKKIYWLLVACTAGLLFGLYLMFSSSIEKDPMKEKLGQLYQSQQENMVELAGYKNEMQRHYDEVVFHVSGAIHNYNEYERRIEKNEELWEEIWSVVNSGQNVDDFVYLLDKEIAKIDTLRTH